MSRALVTGVTGQDGSYLAERLLSEGYEVHGTTRRADESEELLRSHPQVVIHEIDLAEPSPLGSLVREVRPDVVYNLAGISSVALSWREPLLTSQVTGLATAVLLDALRDLQASGLRPRLVQASSSEIFGNPPSSPQDESTPIAPLSPYGVAKAYAHLLVGAYRAEGLHASSAVLYNHESPRRPEAFVTRKITRAAVRIAAGVQDRLELGALDVARDWGWAPDYVDAMVRIAALPKPGDYVVATGASHTVAQFVEAAFRAVGISDWQRYVSTDPAFVRPNEIRAMVGDAGRLRRETGWEPTVDFSSLVERMVRADQDELAAADPA